MRVSHIVLIQLKIAPLPRILAERPLVLHEERASSKLGERFTERLHLAVPYETAHHASAADIVLVVLESVVVHPKGEAEEG